MHPRLDRAVRRWWRGEAGRTGALLSALAWPLELAYRGGVAVRNGAYDAGWLPRVRPAVPVISVGNLLVGGTGKTPVAAWIARLLAESGHRPGIVTRGYGDDEIALHRRWNPDLPVFVDADRARAVAEAVEAGRDAVVLDDGFQHRRLRRDLDLVLIPVEGTPNERLLPRGPYREPPHELGRADRIVLTRRTADRERAERVEAHLRSRAPELPVSRLRLVARRWCRIDGEPVDAPDGPVLAVTGIARPRSFRELVERATGSTAELVCFPDHHAFSAEDLREIDRRAAGRSVVTTEKDAVRLEGLGPLPSDVRVLTLAVEEESDGRALRDDLLRTAREARAGSAAAPGEAP